MTKSKSTKRALLMSALALITCVSMLVGSTFAWFTDSVTSSGNIIKSGTLDVTMEWFDGTKAVPAADSFTQVRHIKIANEGSLALKYQIVIEANGVVSDLADVIDVYYADPAVQVAGRNDLTADKKLGTLTQVLAAVDTTASGVLEAGKNDTITIALKMQETAGNEYQGKEIGTDFKVILVATQADVESDSFGPDYDAGLTPPDADGNILVEENGIQYVYTPEGENVLYLVTEDYAEDTIVIPEGVTTIGNYAFAYNSNVKEVVLPSSVKSLGRGFDSSTVEKVVLNEGLEQIDSRAFRSTPNLKEVVIPSTVKTIADNAFQKSGIKEIVIPASVETIGETAFGSSKIETVTIEGNTSVQGYAFRGCPELRTVYLKGDDVTFIPSTLNGRNSMWFCNGESNNPNTSNITFYTENETVAARVKTAMGAEANNTKIYVDGKITIKVDTADKLATELAAAQPGTVIDATGVTLVPVDDLDSTVTIPAGVTVKGVNFTPNGSCWLKIGGGDQVVFEDCTFNGLPLDQFKIAADSGANVTYTNCAFTGFVMINNYENREGVNTFNNCTFGLANGFMKCGYVNCMSGENFFNQCTFNYAGGSTRGSNQYMKWNAVNAYSENTNTNPSNNYTTYVELNGCVFNGCSTYKNTANSTLVVK